MSNYALSSSINYLSQNINKFNYMTESLIDIDILIIGAGISGLYTCYKAIKKNSNKKILCLDKLSFTFI